MYMRGVYIALLLLIVVGVGAYFFGRSETVPETEDSPAVNGGILQLSLGEPGNVSGVQVLPLLLVEDSRCPSHVQCIQSGTVRVQAQIVSGMGTSTMVMELDRSLTTEAEEVTLIDVTPVPREGVTIAPGEYTFTFRVNERTLPR